MSPRGGWLEEVGGLKTREARHSKADVLAIQEMYSLNIRASFFEKNMNEKFGFIKFGTTLLPVTGYGTWREGHGQIACQTLSFIMSSNAGLVTKPCIVRFFHVDASRFVGKSWNAQKKRQIPLDSWWCADSKNVIFIKIGRWPFSKIALLCLTRYLFL